MPVSKVVQLRNEAERQRIKRKAADFNITGKAKRYPRTEELIEASTVEFDGGESSLDLLCKMREVLLNSLPVAEGLFRKKTSQSSTYALSNLMNQLQEVERQIEEQIDWEEIGQEVSEIVVTVVESMVLELGQTIKEERKDLKARLKPKERKAVKATFDRIYRRYGKTVQEKLEDLKESITEYMIS